MANLIEWIESTAEGEPIQAVVIGKTRWYDYGKENIPTWDKQPRGKVISWEKAKEFLDYQFNSGFGAPGCNAIYAWTKSKVIFVSQYDGSTSIEWVPRDPIECNPEMPGG